ncbi:MAG: hypothetical protein V9G63_08560 [Candidatus Competibacter sp.]|jgi:hypothetical protein|nr:hypothetical protein [Candidatus Competibacteraceae bacterium]
MSELELVPSPTPAERPPSLFGRLFKPYDIGFYLMVILAWISSVYTSYDLHNSRFIWRWLIPIFGAICIYTQWNSVPPTLQDRLRLVLHQVLHWGVMTALAFLLIMSSTGQYGFVNIFDSRQVGFVISLMLAFSTYLAGLYHDWRLCVVAAFILAGAIINVAFSNLAPLLLWIGLGILVLYLLGAWLFSAWQQREPPAAS